MCTFADCWLPAQRPASERRCFSCSDDENKKEGKGKGKGKREVDSHSLWLVGGSKKKTKKRETPDEELDRSLLEHDQKIAA